MTTPSPPNAPIVIVAPCPLGKGAVEGWMSRIRAIDAIFEGQERIYLDVISGNAPAGPPHPERHGEVCEYRIDMMDGEHRRFVESKIAAARFVYVHTIHLARYVLPYYMTGKLVTDIHGIVPEEEVMLGRPAHADFYEAVEASVIMASRLLVVVTEAMRDHLLAKYPECKAEFLIAPIIESHQADLGARTQRAPGSGYRALYAGGAQSWQNLAETLAIAARVKDICTFDFLSHEHDHIAALAEPLDLTPVSRFRVVDKHDLAQAYLQADFGFVLRDPVAVNRVACPTKLSEYLWFGVIPVVKTPLIGDFHTLGFAYLTADDFAAGLFPDEPALAKMRARNRAIIEALSSRFATAAGALRNLILPNRIAGSGLAGLPVGDRHLVFPNQAEAYLFGDATHYASRAIAGAYEEMEFAVHGAATAARIVPVLSDMSVRLPSIEFHIAGEQAPNVVAHCQGGVSMSPDSATILHLTKAAPYIDIGFDRKTDVRGIRFETRFDSLGPRAPGLHSLEPASLAIRFVTANGAVIDRTARIAAP